MMGTTPVGKPAQKAKMSSAAEHGKERKNPPPVPWLGPNRCPIHHSCCSVGFADIPMWEGVCFHSSFLPDEAG